MFHSVKEKRNLFSHELWACGDYNNLGFDKSNYINSEISSEYSSNGNYGAKLTIIQDTSLYIGKLIEDVNNFKSNTIKFSIDVNTNHQLSLRIVPYEDATALSSISTSIAAGTKGTVYVQGEIPLTATKLAFRIYAPTLHIDDNFYTDNWCLEEV